MRSMTEGEGSQADGRVSSPTGARGATSPWRGRIVGVIETDLGGGLLAHSDVIELARAQHR
jgi:hypothetical protein